MKCVAQGFARLQATGMREPRGFLAQGNSLVINPHIAAVHCAFDEADGMLFCMVKEDAEGSESQIPVSYTHLTLPTTPYV